MKSNHAGNQTLRQKSLLGTRAGGLANERTNLIILDELEYK
jgi:hypothetical protein